MWAWAHVSGRCEWKGERPSAAITRVTRQVGGGANQNTRRVTVPVYEFRCLACDHKFSKKVEYGSDPMHDPSILFVDCPKCKGQALRSFSMTSVSFFMKD